MNKRINISQYIAEGLIFLALGIIQFTPGLLPRIFGGLPLPLIPAVICVAMFEREFAGAMFGLASGMMWDVFSIEIAGFNAIFLLVIGCVAGLLINFLMRNNLITALLLTGGTMVIYQTLYTLFFFLPAEDISGIGFIIYARLIPSLIYTMLFVPVIYFVIRATVRKLKPTDT